MTDFDDIRERLEDVEEMLLRDQGPCLVVVAPERATFDETPDVPTDGICVTDEETGRETVAVPNHLPPSLGGVECLTKAEIAELWHQMPEDVRTVERKVRAEQGDPIPPLLQQEEGH